MRGYVRWSKLINVLVVVMLPALVIVLSNVLLVATLNER